MYEFGRNHTTRWAYISVLFGTGLCELRYLLPHTCIEDMDAQLEIAIRSFPIAVDTAFLSSKTGEGGAAGGGGEFGRQGDMEGVLQFDICYNNQVQQISLPNDQTVGELKGHIDYALGIDIKNIYLTEVQSVRAPIYYMNDDQMLRELELGTENLLQLCDNMPPSPNQETETVPDLEEEVDRDFKLTIILVKPGQEKDQIVTTYFHPLQTVFTVKHSFFEITDIPISQQVWEGWPNGAHDQMKLRNSGIAKEHQLVLSRRRTMMFL